MSGCISTVLMRYSIVNNAVRLDAELTCETLLTKFADFFITETGCNPVAAVSSETFTTCNEADSSTQLSVT